MTYNPTSPKTVLLIDDDELLSQLISITLEMESISTVTAHNGHDALALLQTLTPSMILLDMMMPEMDGLSFLQSLRKHEKFAQIPVLVMSALDRPDVQDQVFLAGGAGFLHKPVQIPVLLEEVKKLLNMHG